MGILEYFMKLVFVVIGSYLVCYAVSLWVGILKKVKDVLIKLISSKRSKDDGDEDGPHLDIKTVFDQSKTDGPRTIVMFRNACFCKIGKNCNKCGHDSWIISSSGIHCLGLVEPCDHVLEMEVLN